MAAGTSERSLSSSPSMPLMFGRAAAALVPGASRLPFVAGGGTGRGLPDLVLTLDEVAVDRRRVAAYDRVCGFNVSDVLPATYPHMLAFPLHLALMTDGSFPFPAIGLVHIANEIRVHRPVLASERLSLRVWAADLREHPRGLQFSVHSQARVGPELAWESISTNLRRGSGSGSGASGDTGGSGSGASGEPAPTARASEEPIPASAHWRLPGDLGRRYAAVSGDSNPIHMSGPSARLFGFPRAIAHGMWTKARCLAALASELPDSFTVSVEFKRPILLPATVAFAEQRGSAGEIRLAVRDAKRASPHLDGTVTPAG
jgi:acyl dehydratase